MAFESTGAHLTTTNTVRHARLLVEHDGLSAAILDHALPDGDATSLCMRLTERGIPFLVYSGYPTTEGPCKDAPHLIETRKPRPVAGRYGSPDPGFQSFEPSHCPSCLSANEQQALPDRRSAGRASLKRRVSCLVPPDIARSARISPMPAQNL